MNGCLGNPRRHKRAGDEIPFWAIVASDTDTLRARRPGKTA
ncbi:hypothetical protein I553_5247 [Mycobacterium xenopi 4042]|uniref:Uncharacterized protein n=1 Tax=Mycobacterium xenopi 4042 TaxID=1299334 RepID=X7ZW90_MYCXE|nr:hypothetical protein I553_5247 [Mycobacterium xenopi 4042]